MHLFHSLIRSDAMEKQTEVNVLLPERLASGERLPVLYLLHGHSQDHNAWLRQTALERYVEGKGLAIVMPNGYRSWYTDTAYGERGFAYLTDELPRIMQATFPVSWERGDTFIAGLSMGGRGAFMLALMHPDKFARAAVLSMAGRNYECLKPYAEMTGPEFFKKAGAGELNLKNSAQDKGINPRQINSIVKYPTVGDFLASHENVWDRFIEVYKAGKLIDMYCAIGTKDHLYDFFCQFRELATRLNAGIKFEEMEGYQHEWRFWDINIQRAIEFFGLKKGRDAGNPY